jgi:hypothetical protein
MGTARSGKRVREPLRVCPRPRQRRPPALCPQRAGLSPSAVRYPAGAELARMHSVDERRRAVQGARATRQSHLCLAHSGLVKLDARKAAAKSAKVRRAKADARRETLRDKLARKLEEHADEVVDAYLKGVRSSDPHQAYKAAEAWLSRVQGRPTQTVETTSPKDAVELVLSPEDGTG